MSTPSTKVGIDHLTLELRKHVGDEAYSYLSPRVHMPKGRTEKEIPALANERRPTWWSWGTVDERVFLVCSSATQREAVLYQLHKVQCWR